MSAEVAKVCRESNCIIRLVDPDFADGDVQDMGKFWVIHAVRGYVFMLDDDLLYPQNYCEQHIKVIEQHQAITTVHARWLKCHPINNYYNDTRSLHYRRKCEPETIPVAHIGGTGTVAFSTDYYRPKECARSTMLNFAGLADIYFALHARVASQEIRVLPRPEFWLKDTKAAGGTTSIYVRTRHDTSRHCKLLNGLKWEIAQ